MSHKDRLVLVTGATGFVAGQVIKNLLASKYHVRGTVRSVSDTKKHEHLRNLPGATSETLQLVEADLTSTKGWEEVCKGCTSLMHVASPFPLKPVKNEELELMKPAVEGTRIVLDSALKAGIKKAIVTSSTAAVVYGRKPEEYSTTIFSEQHWSVLENIKGYERSKTLAEKAVWDFHSKHQGQMEIATVNPSFIVGPALSKNTFTSGDLIERLLKGEVPALPEMSVGVVDVRDVAKAHLLALENPKSDGNRYLLVERTLWFSEIAQILDKEFRQYGYKIPSRVVGKWPIWFVSLFNKQVRSALDRVGIYYKYDNSKSLNELGLQYTPIEKSIIDMAYSLIETGRVPDKIKIRKQD